MEEIGKTSRIIGTAQNLRNWKPEGYSNSRKTASSLIYKNNSMTPHARQVLKYPGPLMVDFGVTCSNSYRLNFNTVSFPPFFFTGADGEEEEGI